MTTPSIADQIRTEVQAFVDALPDADDELTPAMAKSMLRYLAGTPGSKVKLSKDATSADYDTGQMYKHDPSDNEFNILDILVKVIGEKIGSAVSVQPATTVTNETSWGIAPAVGNATKYAREDHTHGSPAQPSGGTPADTVVSGTSFGQTPSAGQATTYSRGDHGHGTPTESANIPTSDEKAALGGTSGTPSSSNKFVTNADSRNTNSRAPTQHGLSSATYHSSSATSGKMLKADANGLPADASNTDTEVSGAVSASHARSHSISSASDHTSSITPGKMMKAADVTGIPAEASNTDTEVASAVSLKHSNSLDHSRSHSITSSSDHTGDASASGYMIKGDAGGLPVKATNTDSDVSDAVSKRHSNSLDHSRQHGYASTDDHTSALTKGKLVMANASTGMLDDAQDTDSAVHAHITGTGSPHTAAGVGAAAAAHTHASTDITSFGSLLVKADSVSVNDDGTITTFPQAKTGTLEVWINDHSEHGHFWIDSTGIVTVAPPTTNNVAKANTDGCLCVYTSDPVGTNPNSFVIKNRLGATKTVRYLYWYS